MIWNCGKESKLDLIAAGKTDTGIVRLSNEDNFIVDEKLGLLVVADGMGGHAAGEIASKMAVGIISDHLKGGQKFFGAYNDAYSPSTNNLNSALRLANLAIFEAAESSPQLRGMGTTVAAVLICDSQLSIAHIGDSRIYLARSGNIEQLTDDHSMINEQIRRDLITREEAVFSTNKNYLTKALGISAETEADLNELTLLSGDILLLCTDGLSNMINDEIMLETILFAKKPAAICDLLINKAIEKGGKDNITAVIGCIKKKKLYSALFNYLASFRR
jgi:serine/threonine protein phosphatase PrpC